MDKIIPNSCPEELKTNYKINITGTYVGDGITLGG